MSALWTGVLVAGVGCYLAKLTGLSVPQRVLRHPRVSLAADLLPIALLSALVAVQVFGADRARRARVRGAFGASVTSGCRNSGAVAGSADDGAVASAVASRPAA